MRKHTKKAGVYNAGKPIYVKLYNHEDDQGVLPLVKIYGQRPFYGYRNSKTSCRIEINPGEAKIVLMIHDALRKDMNCDEICDWINKQGFKGRNGRPFSPSSIATIIIDEMNQGFIEELRRFRTRKSYDQLIKQICEMQ